MQGVVRNVRCWAWAVIVSCATLPALAADVDITLFPENETLLASLDLASLSAKAVREGSEDPDALVAAARADYARLLGSLYAEGYFAPDISIKIDGQEATDISPFEDRADVASISIEVRSGARYRFGEISITPIAPDANLPDTLRPGAVARTTLMREALDATLSAWRAAGHAKVELVSQDIIADHEARTVSLFLDFDPGPRLRFGRIIPDPDSAVIPERQSQITGLIPGTIFDPVELARAETRLQRTDIFSSAVIREAEDPEGDTLPLILELADRKPRRFGFGAEISTIDGGRLSAFWLHRNFTQEAVRLRVDAEIGGIGGTTGETDTLLSFSATRPATSDPEMDATANLRFESLREPTFESDLAEATIGIIRRERENLVLTAEIGLRYDESLQDEINTTYRHAIIGTGATWDYRNNTLDPRRGWYADLDLLAFVGFAGSETGLRSEADLRGYLSVSDHTVLAARGQFGAISSASITGTPPSFLFYSGGGGSVRGQEFQSLGVPAGDPDTGGRGWLGFSGELRQDLTDALQAVAFLDAGYISADPDFSDGEWHAGAGLGGRYLTPIGPIRVDVGLPIEGTSEGAVLYIGIGQAF